jgi:hypothetical protein
MAAVNGAGIVGSRTQQPAGSAVVEALRVANEDGRHVTTIAWIRKRS